MPIIAYVKTECPVCLEEHDTNIVLSCGHLCCSVCTDKLERCPICRASFTANRQTTAARLPFNPRLSTEPAPTVHTWVRPTMSLESSTGTDSSITDTDSMLSREYGCIHNENWACAPCAGRPTEPPSHPPPVVDMRGYVRRGNWKFCAHAE